LGGVADQKIAICTPDEYIISASAMQFVVPSAAVEIITAIEA
jgi:hypothetical protein